MGGSNKAIIPVRFHLTPAEGAFAVLGGFGPRTPGSPSPLQGSEKANKMVSDGRLCTEYQKF